MLTKKKNPKAFSICISKKTTGSIRHNPALELFLSSPCHSREGGNPVFGVLKVFAVLRSVISIIPRIIISLGSLTRRLLKQKTKNTRLGYDLEIFSSNTQKQAAEFSRTTDNIHNDLINFFRTLSEIVTSVLSLVFKLVLKYVTMANAVVHSLLNTKASEKKEKQKLKQLSNTVSKLEEQNLISTKIATDLKRIITNFSKLKTLLKKQRVAIFSTTGIAIIVTIVIATNLLSSIILPSNKRTNISQAATFHWVQNAFTGGASTTAIAIHANNQTGWNYYYSTDEFITTTTNAIYLATTTASTTETSDADFLQGATTSTLIIGTGDDAYLSLKYEGSSKDLSAYNFNVGATTTIIYRSSGVGGTNEIASGSATKLLTIDASGNLTFSGTQIPDRVGVGDAIVYDSNNSNTITSADEVIFIHDRTSNSAYTVKTENGQNTATTTASNDTWTVYRAYTSLSNAEASVNNTSILPNYDSWSNGKDLVAANQIWNIACYGDAIDTTSVSVSDWVTATTSYVRIYTPYLASEVGVSQRHNGKWDSSKFFIRTSDSYGTFYVGQSYTVVEGLQMMPTTYAVDYREVLRISNSSNPPHHVYIKNNIFKVEKSDTNIKIAISSQYDSGRDFYIYNNLFYDFKNWSALYLLPQGAGCFYVFNNTFVDSGRVSIFNNDEACAVMKNNLSIDMAYADYYGGYSGESTNNGYSLSVPLNFVNNVNLTSYASTSIFINPANDDFRLKKDSPAIDQGADLSSDTDLSFANDIGMNIRPYGVSWDIGADEYGGYYATGTFTSQIKDSSANVEYGTVSWSEAGYIDGSATSSLPASTTLYVKIRTSNSPSMVGATGWSLCNPVLSGYDISNNNCVNDGDRYFQYRVEMTSDLIDTTPTFSNIEISYEKYPTNQGIISSPYDSNDVANIIAGISWTENTSLPTGTAVILSIRSGANSAGVLSALWTEVASSSASGFLTDGCSKIATTVSCVIGAIPENLKDGVDERFIQYQLTLSSEGQYTPSAGNVNLTYVVNAAPSFDSSYGAEGATAYQVATTTDPNFGKVKISYSIKDVDSTTGNVTQNHITPRFQYSLNNGSTWNYVATTSAILSYASGSSTAGNITDTNSDNDIDNQVYENSYITYYAYWNANAQLSGTYSTTTKIRLIITDNEAANNSASASTTIFRLDAKDPTLGSPAIQLSASTTPATLIFSTTDNSNVYYELAQGTATTTCLSSLGTDYSDAYIVSTTIALAGNPRTVCLRYRDEYNNTTTVQYATTPENPTNFMIQDTSNLKGTPYEYRLFLAWRTIAAPSAGFGSYYVYRSEDGTNFSRLATVSPRTTNYYGDSSVIFDTEYWYRVTGVDSQGNESFVNETIAASANGTQDGGEGGGGNDSIAPVISNISTTTDTIYSNSATIYWDTNELSNSVIGYSTTPGIFTTFSTSTAIKDNEANFGRHEITAYNLTSNTTYYFLVRSIDPMGNIGTDNNSGIGYSFTTKPGPIISNVTIPNVGNEEATIEWSTDIEADSVIYYSTNSSLSNATSTSNPVLSTNHSMTLNNLNQGAVYYFRIESSDISLNKAIDSNSGNYYSFVTTIDNTPPTLLSGPTIAAYGDTYATINWMTDERATARVDYGTVSGIYPDNYSNGNLDSSHSITLTNLTKETPYYYRLVSSDKNSNILTTGEYTFTTKQELYEQDEVDQQVEDAQNSTPDPIIIREGGGILVVDKTDKIPPKIMNVKIEEVKATSAIVSWATDEETVGLVRYSEDDSYDFSFNQLDSYSINHLISFKKLSPLTKYNFKVASIDKAGNLAYSDISFFSTLSQSAEELAKAKEELNFDEVMKLTDKKSVAELYQFASDAMGKALDIFSQISGNVSLTQMESALGLSKEKMELLAKNIPAPLLSGEPRVITTAKTATIAWQTNKDSNSLVAISPEESYNAKAEEPYLQVVGNNADRTTKHVVTIHSLIPDTLYHYQVRSQAELGPQSKSPDFTFRTDKETLDIKNFVSDIISPEEAIFRWVTNIEGNSQVRYTPYRNNILIAEETKTKDDKAITTIHEINIKDFESGVLYKIELSSTDPDGIIASKEIDFFSTAKDDLSPSISDVKTNSALSTGANTKVQTIVFWKTNELSTGQVFWSEGLIGQDGKLSEAVKPDNNYSREHTAVITKFEPGKIYTFRVESSDSTGNKSVSQNFTVLAPKQKESVFQIIMKSLEESFGWVGNMRK